MPLLLCIDTATANASIALVKDDIVSSTRTNKNQKDHASFLQPAIHAMMHEMNIQLSDLNAIAVTAGPGSYTGLRVGLSSAKGLCYALQLPLITLSTTLVMSYAALQQLKQDQQSPTDFFLCPMIDARRMEVFTATYDRNLKCIKDNRALILENHSFSDLLEEKITCFFGDGALKWKQLCNSTQALFTDVSWNASDMMIPALERYRLQQFASVAYTLPEYGKEFNNGNK